RMAAVFPVLKEDGRLCEGRPEADTKAVLFSDKCRRCKSQGGALKVGQMRRLGPMLIATFVILAAGAEAQVHDTPLFADFKVFCVDTGARPDAVKSAVEAAGGKQHAPPGATAWPFPMTVTSWDITTDGRSLSVSAGTQQAPPVQNRPGENSNQCIMR